MLHKLTSAAGVPPQGPTRTEGGRARMEHRADRVFLLLPAASALALAVFTVVLTRWCLRDTAAHPHQPVSPAALLVGFVYLLVLVAVIRLLCFGGMLLSRERKEFALDVLPGVWLKHSIFGSLQSPAPGRSKRLGCLALAEAVAVLGTWVWCVARLLKSAM